MKRIIYIVAALVLIACATNTVEARVKITSVNTTYKLVYAIYATSEQDEIRQDDIRFYKVNDLELWNELHTNIGNLYDITVQWDGMDATIVKAVRVYGR